MAQDTERRAPDSEKRLILLYILSAADRISDLQLLQLLTANGMMNYFDMMMTLADLCAQGQCVRTEATGRNMYAITPAGREAVELFRREIPASIRTRLDEDMPSWLEEVRSAQAYPVSWRQTKRGEYTLEMGICEKDMDVLRITLSLPGEDIARDLGSRWREKAGDVYRALFDMLGKDKQ